MEVDSRSFSCIFGLAWASDPSTAETIGREMAKIGSQGRAQHSYYICSVSQQSPRQEPLKFTGSGQRESPLSHSLCETWSTVSPRLSAECWKSVILLLNVGVHQQFCAGCSASEPFPGLSELRSEWLRPRYVSLPFLLLSLALSGVAFCGGHR